MDKWMEVYNRKFNNTVYRQLSRFLAHALGLENENYNMIRTSEQGDHNRLMILFQDAAFEICGKPKTGKLIQAAIELYDLPSHIEAAFNEWLLLFSVRATTWGK